LVAYNELSENLKGEFSVDDASRILDANRNTTRVLLYRLARAGALRKTGRNKYYVVSEEDLAKNRRLTEVRGGRLTAWSVISLPFPINTEVIVSNKKDGWSDAEVITKSPSAEELERLLMKPRIVIVRAGRIPFVEAPEAIADALFLTKNSTRLFSVYEAMLDLWPELKISWKRFRKRCKELGVWNEVAYFVRYVNSYFKLFPPVKSKSVTPVVVEKNPTLMEGILRRIRY